MDISIKQFVTNFKIYFKTMKNILLIFFFSIFSFGAHGKSLNVIKFTCEYSPDLITTKQKNIDSTENQELDRQRICSIFYCNDFVEVNISNSNADGKDEYRLRNSWFNHQGILIDEFKITKKKVVIDTYVSQSYFLESYVIDRVTGKTKRTFYRFDDSEYYYDIKKIEKDINEKQSNFDKKKVSIKTLKSYSVEPKEIFYFEGICLEGTGV